MVYSLLLKFHTIKRGHVIFVFILWNFFIETERVNWLEDAEDWLQRNLTRSRVE